MDATVALERLRGILRGWPGCVEATSFGHPAFKVGTRTLAVLETYRGVLSLSFPAGGDQELLLARPGFYRPPYVGNKGWVSLALDPEPDWDMVAAVLEAALRRAVRRKT